MYIYFIGTYQGQWLRGLRHGYGVRTSAPFGMASHNKLSETRMASMSSLNQEAGGEAIPNNSGAGVVEAAANAMLEDPENGAEAGTPGRAISRRGEEARGGFVLRAKSEDMPARRRSLVERSGMKTLVQVRIICVEGHHAGISEGHFWSLKQFASCTPG